MQKQEKGRKPLIIGVIAAVVILAVVLALLLTQCIGGGTGATTDPNATTTVSTEVPTYELYWNADRAEYDGKSEAGMSSRMPESDGYFHVRFILDGKEVVLKVADRKLINAIDIKDLMGLEFDENGIVVGVIDIDDMPLEKLGWQFYVQSAAKKLIKLNSSESMNGMEVLLELNDESGIYDMTGMSGPVGVACEPINLDRVYAVANLAGEVTHVFVYQRPNYMLTHEAECQHCEKTVTWYEWNKENKLPTESGHYQLVNDVVGTTQNSMVEDAKICLDLNGHRVDGKSGSRVYSLHNAGTELAIMDTSEAKTGVLAAHGKGDQGMVVWVRYGQFHLYSGTLDASDAVSKINGVAVECGKGKYFYMHGGTIIGGKAEPQKNDKGNWTNGLGGALSIGGKFVMNDGEIRDGYAESKVTWKNGSPTYNRGFGGNIFASGSSVIELNGGVIKNGRAGNCGGNIYMDGAAEVTINGTKILGGTINGKGRNGGSIFVGAKGKLTLTSGVIAGGASRNCAGNVYTNGVFTMTGGSIYGGTIRNYSTGKLVENSASSNVFIVNGQFNMYGGKIDGGVQAIDTSATDARTTRVYLTTHATIDGGKFNERSLTLSSGGSGVVVSVGKMRDEARVGIHATTGYFTLPTLEENKDNFFSSIEGAEILYHDGRLALGRMQCICGKEEHFGACDGTKYVFAPHITTTNLPTATGKYYLLQDVKMSGTGTIVTQGDGVDVDVVLDLNGFNVTKGPGNNRIYSLFENKVSKDENGNYYGNIEGEGCAVTLSDSVGTATVDLGTVADGDQGLLVWGRYNDSKISIYGGTYLGSGLTSLRHGGVVIATAGELNMYGGTIDGGNSTGGGIVLVNGKKAVFNMHGGVIKNGTAKNGGNIYINTSAVMNMYGGSILDGSCNKDGTIVGDLAYGGNIDITSGTLNMYGGEIAGGYVKSGIKGEAADGTAISGGGGLGGNIRVGNGTANLLGGVIRDGYASHGGNIGTNNGSSSIILDGVQLLDGEAYANGGNLAVNVRAGKPIEIKGDTLISGGTAASNGGNLYASPFIANGKDSVFNILGGIIRDGVAGSNGGNGYFTNPNSAAAGKTIVNIDGAVITGGTAANQGGNFYTTNAAVSVNLNSGEISNGQAILGGNISARGPVNILGGTVKDGIGQATEATYTRGGNIYVTGASAKLLISGADTVISGGLLKSAPGKSWMPGGSIAADGKASITVEGGATVTGGDGQDGNNFYLTSAGTALTLKDCTIENTVDGSGSIMVERGDVTIDGATIINKANGYNLRANEGGKVANYTFNSGLVTGGHPNVTLGGDDTFVMNGGTIENGSSGSHGGNISLSSSKFTINGGTITGGVATKEGGNICMSGASQLIINGGEIKDGTANGGAGGNIIVWDTSSVTLNDGVISGGTCTANGGNISLSNKTTMTVNGGKVVEGESGDSAGNIAVYGKLTVTGGEIKDGKSKNAGNGMNISVINTNADNAAQYHELAITGGKIGGGVHFNNYKGNVVVSISGNPVIDKALSTKVTPTYSLKLGSNDLTIGQLTEGAKIMVSGQEGVFSYKAPEGSAAFFHSEVEGLAVFQTPADELVLVYGKQGCICGSTDGNHIGECDGTVHDWMPVTAIPETSGYYYLVSNITDSGAQRMPETDLDIVLDLNGKTLTSNRWRMFRCNTKINFTVTDNSADRDGKIVIPAARDQGAIFWSNATSTFAMYGGIIDASASKNNSGAEGLVLSGSATVKLFRGTILGGTYGDNNWGGSAVGMGGSKTHYLGNVEITGDGSALFIGDSCKVDMTHVTKAPETPWAIDASGIFTKGWNKEWKIEDYFTSASAYGCQIYLDEATGELKMGTMDCACRQATCVGDCDGKDIFWQPFRNTSNMPTANGNYFLTRDVSKVGQKNINGDTKAIVRLDLNGHSVTVNADSRLYLLQKSNELHVTDSVGTGVINGGGHSANGGIFLPQNTSVLKIYAGNYTLREDATATPAGGWIDVSSSGVSIFGGNFSASVNGGSLIVVRDNLTMNITGGTFTNTANADKEQVTFSLWTGCTLNISNATITTTGENQRAMTSDGTVNMTNCTVTGAKLTKSAGGANICINAKGTLNLTDSTVSGGVTAGNGGNIAVYGKLVMKNSTVSGGQALYGGNIYVSNGTANITGGKITGGKGVATDTAYTQGGNIHITGSSAVVTIDGTTVSEGNLTGTTARGWRPGGNIYMNGGASLTVGGGATIEGGGTGADGNNLYLTGSATKATLNNCTVKNTKTGSNNIMVEAGTLTVDGATITNTVTGTRNISTNDSGTNVGNIVIKSGTVSGGSTTGGSNGGNICICANDTLTVSGGTIIGGHAENQGGNIVLYGTMKMTGGTIKDGVSDVNAGHNIAVISPNADQKAVLEIAGGEIAGGVYFNLAYTTPTVKLSGKPVINKDLTSASVTKPTYGISVPASFDLDLTGLTGGTIYVKGAEPGQFAINATSGMENYFTSETVLDGITLPVVYQNSGLYIAQVHCLCGFTKDGSKLTAHEYWCDAVDHIWLPWTGNSTTTSGYYFLPANMSQGQVEIGNGASTDVVIDLNGYTLTANTRSFRVMTGSLGVTDTVGGGKILAGGTTTQSGSLLLSNGVTINLYAGTWTLKDGASAGSNGGIMDIGSTTVVNMYGGTITGGTAKGYGGNINVAGGTFNFYGGTISGGTSQQGGNVRVSAGQFNMIPSPLDTKGVATRTITGGLATVEEGYGKGGNIYATGANSKVTVKGAKSVIEGGNVQSIKNGAASWAPGGNFCIEGSAQATVTGGATVKGGKNNSNGHNFYMTGNSSKITLDGAVVENTVAGDANIYVEGGTLNIQGSTVLKTIDGSRNINTNQNGDAIINISGGTITGATFDGNGANIWVSSRTKLNISGGTITGGKAMGTANRSGGNIFVSGEQSRTSNGVTTKYNNAVVTITGGTISNGEAQWGANLHLNSKQTHTMSAGTVSGGVSGGNGANIYVGAGTFQLTGGEVKNGSTSDGGGNFAVYGTLKISGGKVYGGLSADANEQRGNIYAQGTVEVIGGEIWGGVLIHKVNENSVCTLKVGGAAVINGKLNATEIPGVTFWGGNPKPITITSKLTGKACIGISTYDWAFANAGDHTAASIGAFYATDPSRGIYLLNATDANAGMLYVGQYHCICGLVDGKHSGYVDAKDNDVGCDGEPVRWTAWTSDNTVPTTAGNYYLTKDVTIAKNTYVNEAVVLDLNGHTITVTAERLYNPGSDAVLTLTNTVKGKGGVIIDGNVWGGGFIEDNATAVTNLYNLHVDMISGQSSYGGALINLKGTLNIFGDTILENGKSKPGSNGGNLMMGAGSVLNMFDGIIRDGVATNSGGGGEGGNMQCWGTMNLYGDAEISNKAMSYGSGNIQLCGNNAVLNMYGGTLTGDLVTYQTPTINIYPNASIVKGQVRGLPTSATVVANIHGDRTGKTPIAVTYVVGTMPVAFAQGSKVTMASKAWFETTDGNEIGFFEDGKLYMVPAGAHMHCICGGQETGDPNHKCYDVLFEVAPATQAWKIESDTNWYLESDLTITGTMQLFSADVKICLNGHNINSTYKARAISLHDQTNKAPELTLTTCTNAGNISKNKVTTPAFEIADMGQLLWVRYGTANLYGVTLDGSKITTKNVVNAETGAVSSEKNGAAINVASVLNIYKGANIIGATTKKVDTTVGDKVVSAYAPNGATMQAGGTVNMYGGTITGGNSANDAGGVYVTGKFTMHDGTITDGVANGSGANLRVDGTFTMNGGLITNGKANINGGNIIAKGKVYIYGGEITNGMQNADKSGTGTGGNIYMDGDNAVLTVKNATIKDGGRLKGEGDTDCYGGNIGVAGKGAKVELGAGAVISGGKAHRGGNLYVGAITANLDGFVINGAEIKNGETSYAGANLDVYQHTAANHVTVTMKSGSFYVADNYGRANICLGAGANDVCYATFKMVDGTINGGKIQLFGKSTFEVTGGKLTNYTKAGNGTLILPE